MELIIGLGYIVLLSAAWKWWDYTDGRDCSFAFHFLTPYIIVMLYSIIIMAIN